MSDVINPTVFRADQKIGFSVAIEITNGWARRMTGDVSFREVANPFQNDFALAGFTVSIPRRVFRIHEQIESSGSWRNGAMKSTQL